MKHSFCLSFLLSESVRIFWTVAGWVVSFGPRSALVCQSCALASKIWGVRRRKKSGAMDFVRPQSRLEGECALKALFESVELFFEHLTFDLCLCHFQCDVWEQTASHEKIWSWESVESHCFVAGQGNLSTSWLLPLMQRETMSYVSELGECQTLIGFMQTRCKPFEVFSKKFQEVIHGFDSTTQDSSCFLSFLGCDLDLWNSVADVDLDQYTVHWIWTKLHVLCIDKSINN